MLAIWLATPAWPQQVATVREAHGTVLHGGQDAGAPRQVAAGDALRLGDTLLTDFDSSATLGLPGGNQVKMYEMSQIRVTDVFQSGDLERIRVFLKMGQVETLAPHAPGGRTDFSVTTPTATAWIRGTRQLVSYAEGLGTRVKFLEGYGGTRAPGGRQVRQKAGQKSSVSDKLELTGPEETAKLETVPALTPPGRDDTERDSTRDYNRLNGWPINDPMRRLEPQHEDVPERVPEKPRQPDKPRGTATTGANG
jgi:ferric-dicitrate binding protein FerR (iron transport regulator)